MPNPSIAIEQILMLLAEAPQRIEALTAGVSSAKLQTSPVSEEWSANDVLAHLRACADVWGHCIHEIIAHHRPILRATNPRTWIEKTDYRRQNFRTSLHAFTAQRVELLTTLQRLPRRGWSRTATVTGAGKPLQRTVRFYAQWLATHERTHIKQIQRIADNIRAY